MVATDLLAPAIARVKGRLDTQSAALRILDLSWEQPIAGDVPASDDYLIDFCPRTRTPGAEGRYTGSVSTRTFTRLGQLYVVPAGQTLTARSDGGKHRVWMCWLRKATIADVMGREVDWTEGRLSATLNLNCVALAVTLRRLVAEACQPGFAHDAMVEALAGQLAVDLCRVFQMDIAPSGVGGLAPWRLRLIDARMREVPVPDLRELAILCGLSVRQLTRSYRTSRNCSIVQDIALYRVERSQQLLRDGTSIKETAFRLGFASPSSFCQAYKRATGEGPSSCRSRA